MSQNVFKGMASQLSSIFILSYYIVLRKNLTDHTSTHHTHRLSIRVHA